MDNHIISLIVLSVGWLTTSIAFMLLNRLTLLTYIKLNYEVDRENERLESKLKEFEGGE